MTYQTTMTTNGFGTSARAVLAHVGAFFSIIGKSMIASSTGQRRLDEVTALQAKSDAELAEMNIKRDDIVHHVFKDLYGF
ncbi:hypothetical protein PVW51_10665 [Sulfitobacter sp. PR48]|uniref:hypothetical protein n=1 Tax=unclassified Sulfitobacter TaxID=196795 RepID=UPI0022AECB7F|nr:MULTISPECIES: hypothetical protein [unclassified Sulfitobacter]MCZ4256095.1 hypothetical protein [Sulfitobacter sp. G21635-S1]MDD9721161.1 hypothetical protein [Sulfitobacter sp. PR48]GLT12687.1 hypothetical protein GCM10007928_49200 [Sulfitobacter porphyrae]